MPKHFHELAPGEITLQLDTDPQRGLSAGEAKSRAERWGLNQLENQEQESIWSILLRQVNSLIVWILAAAAVVSFMLGDRLEAYAILAVIVINALTGFMLEYSAWQSMQALRNLDTTPARVLRDGQLTEVASEYVTTGDILVLEAGDLIAADTNVLETNQLETDESALTSESIPSSKNTASSDKDAPWATSITACSKGLPLPAEMQRPLSPVSARIPS